MRTFDWASTPLGPVDTWPLQLQSYVQLMLASKQPMYLSWTQELIALYNDAYRPILGADKHPHALGTRTADIFEHDGYPGLKPSFDAVLQRGESVALTDVLVPLMRHGYLEECYFEVAFTPVQGEQQVEGIFFTVNETTERYVQTRRAQVLTALTSQLLNVESAAQVAEVVRRSVADHPTDLPFALLYLPSADNNLHLLASAGLDEEDVEPWRAPPEAAQNLDQLQVVSTPAIWVQPWPEPVTSTVWLPLLDPDAALPVGVLAIGLNARKQWDEPYRDFLQRFSRQITDALQSVKLAERLRERRAELEARTQALEARNQALHAFEVWMRDLAIDTEPLSLIEQTQALLRSLIPLDATVYYERIGERWYVRRMVGEYGNDHLRQAHEEGLVHATTGNLRLPVETGKTLYQDLYETEIDHLAPHMTHVTATAMVPLKTARGVRGILGLATFGRSGWPAVERTILETVGHSLELAIDRAERMEELARERTALAIANEDLEAFAYSVSHDLRTPVRHIAGFNALLRKTLGETVEPKAARYLQVVDEAAGRMNALIDAMLDLSRVSRHPLRLGVVDLGTLITAVRAELEPDVFEREVVWAVAPLPLVTGDLDTLRQVLLNFLGNAIKYTRTREVARIEVWAEERPNTWAIFVRDNGVGFDPKYADKLFGVFQRLHRADEFEGTGVGLANVRRIITKHGGEVSAQGQLEEGATFSFTLPK